MKLRGSIIVLCMVVLVGTIFVLWYVKKQPVGALLPGSVLTNIAPSTAIIPSAQLPTNARTAPVTATVSPATNQSQSVLPQDKVGLIKEVLQANDANIVFYGRLEDQFGSAVYGATVNFSIQYENANARGIQRGQVISDGNGFFTISGTGANLGITVQKSGYVLATTDTSFRYSQLTPGYFVPDQSNPTVIKMWKLQGAEHLISFNIRTYVPINGDSVAFDLQTGKQVQSGGDIAVRIQSSVKPNVREEYDWQASIQPVEGGIVDAGGSGLEKMFRAPDSGYELEYDVNYGKQTQSWTSRFGDDFYFKSREGKCCGKVSLEIDTDEVRNSAAFVTLKGYLNPAGSPNLEVDPSLITGASP